MKIKSKRALKKINKLNLVKKYSTSGWLNDKNSIDMSGADSKDYLVVVKGDFGMYGRKGTEVFIYGEDGFAVYN